jgi:hypothetical protein
MSSFTRLEDDNDNKEVVELHENVVNKSALMEGVEERAVDVDLEAPSKNSIRKVTKGEEPHKGS